MEVVATGSGRGARRLLFFEGDGHAARGNFCSLLSTNSIYFVAKTPLKRGNSCTVALFSCIVYDTPHAKKGTNCTSGRRGASRKHVSSGNARKVLVLPGLALFARLVHNARSACGWTGLTDQARRSTFRPPRIPVRSGEMMDPKAPHIPAARRRNARRLSAVAKPLQDIHYRLSNRGPPVGPSQVLLAL